MIVPGAGDEASRVCEFEKASRFFGVQGEGFLDINVRAELQTCRRQSEMRVRGRRHMHDVWSNVCKHAIDIVILFGDIETRGCLIRKIGLAIAHRDDTNVRYFLDFLQMGVGDLAATDNCYA
jgi:hypothetical protein